MQIIWKGSMEKEKNEYNKEAIESKVKIALDKLFRNDSLLLRNDANERSISHKLAEYIQTEFIGWHVDCEYNRDNHYPKKLLNKVKNVKTDNDQGHTVYPDIIIHHRNTNSNLLVIEIKKTTNNDKGDSDHEKLEAFKKELCYKYSLFIKFKTNTKNPKIVNFDLLERLV
jgi:hypothetical protein